MVAARIHPPTVSKTEARRLLLAGQGLLADPGRRATPAAILRQIERLGFVQVDSINAVQRAHHHILMSRYDGYRPPTLQHLLEKNRRLFEHWTHDASIIPTRWIHYWRPRFERYDQAMRARPHWHGRLQGRIDETLEQVRSRIEREGPLRSKDFEKAPEHVGKTGGFWNWTPQKSALEWLWRSGKLSIAGRDGFQKIYDLTERVFPELCECEPPSESEATDWACRAAFERLAIATPAEVAAFLDAVPLAAARTWCTDAAARGELEEVLLPGDEGERPRKAYAQPGWRRRAARLADAPSRTRLLSPFDPLIRDRKRTLRLFDFDYRIEVFVPEKKRRYGYFVLPILEGEQLVGRADCKLQRDQGRLEIKGLWWESHARPTAKRRKRLLSGAELLAEQLGAAELQLANRARNALMGPRPAGRRAR